MTKKLHSDESWNLRTCTLTFWWPLWFLRIKKIYIYFEHSWKRIENIDKITKCTIYFMKWEFYIFDISAKYFNFSYFVITYWITLKCKGINRCNFAHVTGYQLYRNTCVSVNRRIPVHLCGPINLSGCTFVQLYIHSTIRCTHWSKFFSFPSQVVCHCHHLVHYTVHFHLETVHCTLYCPSPPGDSTLQYAIDTAQF